MALQMILSNWLACGWLLSLIVGAGVAILQRPPAPSRLTSLQWSFPALSGGKWHSSWTRYAGILGRVKDERMQIGRSEEHGVVGEWRGYNGLGWRYT